VSQATLLVIQGADQGARFEIGEADCSLGRGAQNAIRIHDTEVSRAHALLQFTNGAYCISDLNSSNGTYVNGEPVRTRALADGDEVQLGRTVLLFSRPRTVDRTAAERIDLRSEPDAGDQSRIVGEAGEREGKQLVTLVAEQSARNRSQALANLQVLYHIAEEVVRPGNSIEQLLTRILEMTIDATGADRGCMLLRDPQTDELRPVAFRHRRGERDKERMPVSRSIVDYVLKNRQGVHTSDARSDARFAPGQSILQAGIREAICVPMQGRYDLQGVIYIDITTPPERAVLEGRPNNRFNEELLRLAVAIGGQSAMAVEDDRYQQALVKSERLAAVGQTIAILSHHIKNILQGVRGGSYLIDMGLKDHNEEIVRKGWGIVEKNQGRIYNLVMDMLTFSKERQPALQRGDLNATVADVYELMQPRAAEMNVECIWQPGEQVPPMLFDSEGIHRAVLNIVSNAFDAVEETERGVVRLETQFDPRTGMVSVIVTDNGKGIEPEMVTQIFNLFESTKGARGTGIGLAVSQKIIREHGGDIHVESTPGAGSRFVLEWPVLDEQAAPSSAPTSVV
jgi:two-component system, NtrC family, sensor kinase